MSNFCHKANGLVAIFNRRSQIQRTNLPLLYHKQNRRGSLKSGTDHHYTNQHISHFPHTHYYMYNLCHHNMKCTCTHCFSSLSPPHSTLPIFTARNQSVIKTSAHQWFPGMLGVTSGPLSCLPTSPTSSTHPLTWGEWCGCVGVWGKVGWKSVWVGWRREGKFKRVCVWGGRMCVWWSVGCVCAWEWITT